MADPEGEARLLTESDNFEVAIACLHGAGRKLGENGGLEEDAVENLASSIRAQGAVVETVPGTEEGTVFLQIRAPAEVLGKAAQKLRLKKPTLLGMEVRFDWSQRDLFVKQTDGALFGWTERYQCLDYLVHSAAHPQPLRFLRASDRQEIAIAARQPLMGALKDLGAVKETFPLHVESTRKRLLRDWSLNPYSLIGQPLDEVCAYFGPKIAIYFAFLGMYTQWLLPVALLGLYFNFHQWGNAEHLQPPLFGVAVLLWSVLFLRFWRRRNTDLAERWEIRAESDEIHAPSSYDTKPAALDHSPTFIQPGSFLEVSPSSSARAADWSSRLREAGGTLLALLAVAVLQCPVELAFYWGLYRLEHSTILTYAITGLHVGIVGYLTKFGGKIGQALNISQSHVSSEAAANSLVYKVFGLYFVQSFMGLLYIVIARKDFAKLSTFMFRRMVTAQVMDNVKESVIPYVKYRMKRSKVDREAGAQKKESIQTDSTPSSSAASQFLMEPYVASVGAGEYDGSFDDFLELALQFGMVTIFACTFPLVGLFALLNNVIEIRSDSFKLLSVHRRPVPHNVASIGAWLTIFQQVGVIAIVLNSFLIAALYRRGDWQIDPLMAALLFVEHLLLLLRHALAWMVPEESSWVKEKRLKRNKAQEYFSVEILKAHGGVNFSRSTSSN